MYEPVPPVGMAVPFALNTPPPDLWALKIDGEIVTASAGFTRKLTAVDAPVPVSGLAVNVPL